MPLSSKEFLDIQATIECGFTLKRVRDMITTYHHGDSNFILLLQRRVYPFEYMDDWKKLNERYFLKKESFTVT